VDFCSKTVQWPDNFELQSIADSDQSMLCLQLMLIDIFANDTSSDWQTDAVMLSESTDRCTVRCSA